MPSRLRLLFPGHKLPDNAIRVDQGSGYRNPFVVGQWPGGAFADYMDGAPVVRDAAHAVSLFRKLLVKNLAERDATVDALIELRGHNLCCTCRVEQPCHADVLIELANVGAEAARQATLIH